MLSVEVVEDLETEPVTLAEVKAFLVIDSGYTADDTLLSALITSARQILEKYTNLSFGEKTLKVFTDKPYIMLPFGPIGDIDTITNEDGDEVTTDGYKLLGDQFKKIEIGDYPYYESGVNYQINYASGYSELPEALKLAIKEQVREMYNNRGTGNSEINLTAQILSDPFSRRSWL